MSKQASDQDQASLVRPEHADQTVRLEGEAAGFAPDSPESIPKLHVPGLSPDATSVPPEALRGEVPTLTDHVSPEEMAAAPLAEAKLASVEADTLADPDLQTHEASALSEPDLASHEVAVMPSDDEAPASVVDEQEEEALAQEPEPEADTWVEVMQVRIEKLTEEIHLLNDRLDRFEKLPKV